MVVGGVIEQWLKDFDSAVFNLDKLFGDSRLHREEYERREGEAAEKLSHALFGLYGGQGCGCSEDEEVEILGRYRVAHDRIRDYSRLRRKIRNCERGALNPGAEYQAMIDEGDRAVMAGE
jgi:hypothetical protein